MDSLLIGLFGVMRWSWKSFIPWSQINESNYACMLASSRWFIASEFWQTKKHQKSAVEKNFLAKDDYNGFFW